MRSRLTARLRWITVAVNGKTYAAVIHRDETAAELLTMLEAAHAVEADGLQLHTADGMVLVKDDNVWSIATAGDTVYALPVPTTSRRVNPAAKRCPGCWNE